MIFVKIDIADNRNLDELKYIWYLLKKRI